MRQILIGILALFFIAPACAQDGPHTHPAIDAQNAAQDDEIASLIARAAANEASTALAGEKADAAVVKNSGQDVRLDAIETGLAAVNAEIEAIMAETALLRKSVDATAQAVGALEARVTALEGSTPPPDPVPTLPVISISVAPQAADEGGAFTFTLTRAGDLSGASTVAYQAFGEADAADFSGGVIASGIVSFAPQDAEAVFVISTNDDSTVEPDEGFGVALSQPVGATIGQAAASATILNNDQTAPPPVNGAVLSVDRTQRFQTINGWSVTTRAWEQDKVNDRYDPTARENAAEMVTRLVNDAGVNRIRLEIQTGAENRRDYWADFVAGGLTYTEFKAKYYEAFNDNADPFVADPAGFQWSQLDEKVESIVLPMRAAVASKGEKLWVNLNVVDFGGGDAGDLDVAAAPEEYAELVIEALKHLRVKYGLIPDSLEIILEPDNGPTWTGAQIGAAIKAVKSRMASAGFSLQIIAPSTMRAGNALPYYAALKAAGGAADVLAFHTYGSTADADLSAIAAAAAADGIEAAMLEKTGSGVDQFYRDLTLANSSAWLQWGLASKVDNGNYLLLADLAQPEGARLSLASRTRGLSQIWRHVRHGYRRVGTSMNFAGVNALAFEAPGGGIVVAGITTRTKSFTVAGLPAGDYGVEYTTDAALGVHAGDFTVDATGTLAVSIPDAGVIVVYPLTRGPPPVTGAVLPDNADGQPITQLGLGFHKDWQAESPYKNFFNLEPVYDAAKIATGDYDPDTGRICLAAKERKAMRPVRRTQQDGFDIDPGLWVVKAAVSGTAKVSVGGFAEQGSAPGEMRVVGDLTGRTDGQQVTFDGGASGGCVTSLFWGPAKYEGDPNGWNPAFLGYVTGPKILRFMDWSGVGGAKMTRAAQWVKDGSYLVQFNSAAWPTVPPPDPTTLRAGYQFGRIFNLTKRVGAAPWINLPITMGGISVEPELFASGTGNGSFDTMKAAIVANIDTIIPDAEREYRALARMMAQSALNEGHPDNVVILVELHNEVWNYGSTGFARGSHYAAGIGMALTGADNDGYGQGFMAALMVTAVKDVFAEMKPQQELAFVIGFQTGAFDSIKNGVGAFRARHSVAGFKAYEARAGIAQSNLIDVFAGSTGYFSGSHKWMKRSPANGLPKNGNPFDAVDEPDFIAKFQVSKESRQAAHFARIRDWYVGPAQNDNIAMIAERNTYVRDFAVQNGMAGFIQYEGGFHNDVSKAAGTLGVVYPPAVNDNIDFIRSKEGREVQEAAIAALRQIDPLNPARTHGWRPAELPLANYQAMRVTMDAGAPWDERQADELGPCANDNTMGGAWCAAYRLAN